MSRRKVRGLTRTGRQVSEDPDLDNLLSNLSPEEMEELQKEVSTVPDPDPSEIIIVDQTDLNQSTNNKCDSSLANHNDSRTRLQRNQSIEGGPKRESRKQEYLRKMGLNQEKAVSKEGGLQRQHSSSTHNETFKQEKNVEDMQEHTREMRTTQDLKDVKMGQSKRDDGNEKRHVVKEKQENDDYKVKEKSEVKDSSSKTKELIAKLQDRKEDCKERVRKEVCQKNESGEKTKEVISRLQGKQEMGEKNESKTKEFVSKLEKKQNQVIESKTDESKNADELISKQPDLVKFKAKDVVSTDKENMNVKDKELTEIQEHETEKKDKEVIKVKERQRMSSPEGREIQNENHNPSHDEFMSNCVAERNSKNVNKVDEEEDESASMFGEDLERIRTNDPRMTELNVNNSEVIKVKTLIQFAEALKNNTHIKTLALANCRADDHVAYAIAGTLRNNKTITSINMDSNLLTSKGIMAMVQALQHNCTVTEFRFHNQRHICGGKTEMEMTKILKENTTLLKLGYHFELAGPRMTMTNILSRNMDRQRQKRLQEQKQAQAQGNEDKKSLLEVPKFSFNKSSSVNSPMTCPVLSPKVTPKTTKGPCGPPPPPEPPGAVPRLPPPPGPFPPPPPPPNLGADFLKNSLSPVSQRKLEDRSGGRGGSKNSRDQLLASIRDANIKQLKKVELPKLLQ